MREGFIRLSNRNSALPRAELCASVLVMCGNNRARKGAQVKSTSLGNPINITLRLFIFDLALLKFDKVEK